MSADTRKAEAPVNLGQAARDLGFVGWLFITLVGAPSALSILQTALTDFRLSAFTRWLVDGYNDVLRTLALALDPLVIRFVVWVRDLFDFDIALQPHWRPLFMLMLIFVSANARSLWSDGRKGPAVLFVAATSPLALVGCLFSGVIPAGDSPMLAGVAAAQLVALTILGNILGYALARPLFDLRPPYVSPLYVYALRGLVMSALVFAAAYAIEIFAPVVERPDLVALFAGMACYGFYWSVYGLARSDASQLRFGLRIFGGFLFALAVVAVDAAFR